VEALYLVCGVRKPQLKRDPLDGGASRHQTMDDPTRHPHIPHHPKTSWFQRLRKHAVAEAAEGSPFYAYLRILATRYGAPAWLFLGAMLLFWFLFWLFALRPY
jgi:hypothetical protein